MDEERARGYADHPFFSTRRPWDDPEFPVHITGDATGRVPELQEGGGSWTAEFPIRDWETAQRYLVQRMRFRA